MSTTYLTTLGNLKTAFGINPSDTSQDTLLNSYIKRATKAICNYCRRADFGLQTYTRVLSGANTAALVVPDLPLQSISLTGNTTNNSAVITGLPTTGTPNANNLFLYQSVYGPGVPQSAVISDVSQLSSGQITISTLQNNAFVAAPCTATGTGVTLQFGIAVYWDDYALGGTNFGAYNPATTLMVEGVDYYPDYSGGPGTPSYTGIIYAANSYWYKPDIWVYGLITPQPGIPTKNIKVQYLAGYTAVPDDVTDAAEKLIAQMRTTRKFGQGVNSLSNDMSVSLASDKADLGLFTPVIRSLLADYVVVGLPNA